MRCVMRDGVGHSWREGGRRVVVVAQWRGRGRVRIETIGGSYWYRYMWCRRSRARCRLDGLKNRPHRRRRSDGDRQRRARRDRLGAARRQRCTRLSGIGYERRCWRGGRDRSRRDERRCRRVGGEPRAGGRRRGRRGGDGLSGSRQDDPRVEDPRRGWASELQQKIHFGGSRCDGEASLCNLCSLFFCRTCKLSFNPLLVVDLVVAPERRWLDPFACKFLSRQQRKPRSDLGSVVFSTDRRPAKRAFASQNE